MRVYMNFGAATAHHALYDEILQSPPGGVEYITHGVDTKKIPAPFLNTYRAFKKATGALLSPLLRKAIVATSPEADLVQFCDNIDFCKKRFICDFEHAWSFLPPGAHLDKAAFDVNKETIQSKLKQETCKVLMPWNKKSMQSVINAYGYEGLEEKMSVVPLSMRIPENHEPIEHNGFNLLFLGTKNHKGDWNWYYRGGNRMLRAFAKFVEGKKDVKLTITGEVPRQEESRLRGLPVSTPGLLSKEQFEKVLRTADVLYYPAYFTPGLAFLEAMRRHVPIVAADLWANSEIVTPDAGITCKCGNSPTEGPYGITPIEEQYLPFELKEKDETLENNLVEALEKLYGDRKLARKLGEGGFRKVCEGELSIDARNKRLLENYERALG